MALAGFFLFCKYPCLASIEFQSTFFTDHSRVLCYLIVFFATSLPYPRAYLIILHIQYSKSPSSCSCCCCSVRNACWYSGEGTVPPVRRETTTVFSCIVHKRQCRPLLWGWCCCCCYWYCSSCCSCCSRSCNCPCWCYCACWCLMFFL